MLPEAEPTQAASVVFALAVRLFADIIVNVGNRINC
jgi:hypothetical protein